MNKTLVVLCCAAALSVPAFTGAETKTPTCCAKKAAAEQTAKRMRCSLTGKIVDKCCCIQREGKFHCTLADKDVEKCCCTEVKDEGAQDKASTAR